MKRLFDIMIALFVLLFFGPMIIVTAVLIRVKIGTPVLFKQQRPGLKGKPFILYKFRSMTDEKDANGNLLADDRRLTEFGKNLRKYSLDEFPQLINVLKGDISLVGPRPLKMEYLPLYSLREAKRHDVKPGITGWAQVNGRNLISWDKRFELDLWYVENQSFTLDCKILMMTLLKVFKSEGINQEGHVTMPEFTGHKKQNNTLS